MYLHSDASDCSTGSSKFGSIFGISLLVDAPIGPNSASNTPVLVPLPLFAVILFKPKMPVIVMLALFICGGTPNGVVFDLLLFNGLLGVGIFGADCASGVPFNCC